MPSGQRRASRFAQWGAARRWAALLAGTAVVASVILPSGIGNAAPARPAPDLKSLLAKAKQLSDQINSLNEQANGLRIQLDQIGRASCRERVEVWVVDVA